MTSACTTPLSDETLLNYWAGDGAPDELNAVEEHLFDCGTCTARVGELAAIGNGLKTLARRGRLSGIISRALFNQMQRDGVRIRLYALSPGETIPCTVFPEDELVVASLRADVSTVEAVALSVTGPGDAPMAQFASIPVSAADGDVFWALPGDVVRQFPSIRLTLTMTSAADPHSVLGTYVLEHTAATHAKR